MWFQLIEMINIVVMECGLLTSFHNVERYCDIDNANDLIVSDRCLYIKQDGCACLSCVVKFCYLTWLFDDKRNTTAKVN